MFVVGLSFVRFLLCPIAISLYTVFLYYPTLRMVYCDSYGWLRGMLKNELLPIVGLIRVFQSMAHAFSVPHALIWCQKIIVT
jgi:hypothetical protein